MRNSDNDFDEIRLGILKSVGFVTSILLIAMACLFIIITGYVLYTDAMLDVPVNMKDVAACAVIAIMTIIISLIRQSVAKNILLVERQLLKENTL